MKLKKLLVIFLLTVLLVSQFSWLSISNFSYAIEALDNTQVNGNFHYEQLEPDAKKIYEGIYNMYVQGILETGTQDYDLVANGQFSEDQIKEYENSKLVSAMNAARYAFYADYPEVFYVNFQCLTVRTTKDANENYHAYIGSGRYANYYVPGFNNVDETKQAISEFEAKVNEIVEKANNIQVEKNKTVEQIKFVHNEIINNTGYRLESDCTEGFEGFLGTPYGALVKNQAVCEGYARALKVVLDRLQINCILVQGTHQYEGSAAVPHMWNYVEIEKETNARTVEKVWYAIDATLDDPFLRNTNIDTTDPEFVPGSDIYEGFENTRYCMVGTETMGQEHIAIETVEAAGNYTFRYPTLNIEDYGIDCVTNNNGLVVKFKQDGTETQEYRAGDFFISYNNKGYAEAAKEGKYILIKYHEYRPGDDIWLEGNWGYMNPELYAPGGFNDNGDHIYISVPNSEYMEFAVTTLEPSEGIAGFTYQGDESDFVARSGKLYNPSGIYKAPPYIKYQTPVATTTLEVGPTYHVDVTYDDDLVLAEGATEPGYRMESTGATGAAKSTITNFKFDGKNRVTFDLKFSEMFADDDALYRIYLTGLVGKNSGKEPNYISYGATHTIACSTRMNAAKNWEVFAKPTLLENEDLSMNGWQTSDGKPVSEKLRSRIALVTTRTTQAEKESMNNLMEEQLGNQELITSETYNISLNVCKKYVVKTGHRLRLSLGFPAGYGPEDAGVTFKAYHFITNDAGEVTGVEEIPCVVTQYGLIVTCDSFSPFAIAVTENDGTAVQEKAVIVSATEGGVIDGAGRDEGNILTLSEGESTTLNIVPNEGYEIESVNVFGEMIEITDKNNMNITINYDDVKDGNCIVEASFVAKVVVQKEEARQEVPVQPVAVPAEITMPLANIDISANEKLTIAPVVTETPGIQTYQWYKNGEKLEGKVNKVLEIENATENDSGEYVLKVTTTVETVSAEVESTVCTVTVTPEVSEGFEVTIVNRNADQQLHPGDEFTVNVGIDNVNNIENGLVSIAGKLSYDENVLERVSINQLNGWDITGGFNTSNFKFVVDTDRYVTQGENIFLIRFKVKEDIELTETLNTVFSITNIEGSNGIKDFSANDARLEIAIEKPKEPDRISSEKYEIGESLITNILPNTTVEMFKANVDTNTDLVFTDKDGNTLAEDSLVGTGTILKVGTTFEFTLVVRGDIDGNGKIGPTDLAKLKLHYIEKTPLTEEIELKAADVDGNGSITLTDLSQMKLIIVDLLVLK